MKGGSIKGLAAKIVSGLKFNYLKADDSELGRVDFGVLTVAMMVAALDGLIQPDELKAFSKLAEKFLRVVSVRSVFSSKDGKSSPTPHSFWTALRTAVLSPEKLKSRGFSVFG